MNEMLTRCGDLLTEVPEGNFLPQPTAVTERQLVAPSVQSSAAMFRALGEPTRLRIFQFLRSCCCPVAVDEETGDVRPVSGPTVGEVCCHITGNDRITSTISEHLKELRTAGLILMERRGKHFVCAANPAAVTALAQFFAEDPADTTADASNNVNNCCLPKEKEQENG